MTVCYWCGAKDTLADVGKELDDGKYKMVQCSKCKNAYYVVNKEKMNKQKPQTNEEWLHSLNTEQLAEWFAHHSDFCEICEKHCDNDTGMQCNGDFKERWVEWLKQPHTPKE